MPAGLGGRRLRSAARTTARGRPRTPRPVMARNRSPAATSMAGRWRASSGRPARISAGSTRRGHRCMASTPGPATWHVLPRHVLVGAGLTREAQDPLADDVALDLRGAALDGVGPSPQEHLPAGAGCSGEAQVLRAPHRVVVVDEGGRTEQVDAELVDVHVHLGEHQLGDGALGPGVAGPAVLRGRGCW